MKCILIGFMGVGKNYYGKRLAKYFDADFIDTDNLIEKKISMDIEDIFKHYGEYHFRTLERQALQHFISPKTFVLSTGGGTPCFKNNIDLLNKIGKTVWLNPSIDCILKNLSQDTKQRPLLKSIKDSTMEERKKYIAEILQERKLFYEKAHLKINYQSNLSFQDFLNQIEHFYFNEKH